MKMQKDLFRSRDGLRLPETLDPTVTLAPLGVTFPPSLLEDDTIDTFRKVFRLVLGVAGG